MRSVGRSLWLVGLASLFGACSSFQSFTPREQATGIGPKGQAAAEYSLVAGDDPYGDVRLWSDGAADDMDEEGASVLVLRLGFEVENRSEAELFVDEATLAVRAARTGSGEEVPFELVAGIGVGRVAPGTTGVIDFEFESRADVRARHIEAFEVHWTLRDGAGELVSETTPFQAWDPPRRYGWGWGYDPFWGGAFYGSSLFWGLHFSSVRCW